MSVESRLLPVNKRKLEPFFSMPKRSSIFEACQKLANQEKLSCCILYISFCASLKKALIYIPPI